MSLIAIAERIHDPNMSELAARAWRRTWYRPESRQFCILGTPAMQLASTKARLHSILGLRPDRIVNLLPPDNEIGTWDKAEARESARVMFEWLMDDPVVMGESVNRVVLLGRKVADAFGHHVINPGWGEVSHFHGLVPPIMVLPHPSGRNRTLNDKKLVRELRARVQRFVNLEEEIHA